MGTASPSPLYQHSLYRIIDTHASSRLLAGPAAADSAMPTLGFL